jgi:hypothetical protein
MTYKASDLELEIVEPGDVTFVRLFSRPNAEWDEPPAPYRDMRCDPPPGKKSDYALLYTGDRIESIAAECEILAFDRNKQWNYDEDAAKKKYWVARYVFDKPAIFIPVDRNRHLLNVDRRPFVPGYLPWQEAAHELWSRFGQAVHGLSWWSMHRHQLGRVYAIFHQHKDTIGLQRPTGPFDKLHEDAEWKAFLAANPTLTKLAGTGTWGGSGSVGSAPLPPTTP